MSTEAELTAAERGKSSQIVTLTIPPGEERTGKATGAFLYLVDSPARVRVKLETEAEVDMVGGCGLRVTGGGAFTFFEVRNPNSFAVTVKFFVGFSEYIDQRAAVIEPQTLIVSTYAGTIQPQATIPVPPVITGTRIRRKAVMVSNGSDEMRLQLTDAAGAVAGIIFAAQAHTFPVSGLIGVKNPAQIGGSAVECYISEIYWVS